MQTDTDATQRTDRDFYCTSSEIEYFLKERYLKKTKRKKQENETNAKQNSGEVFFFVFFARAGQTEEPPQRAPVQKKDNMYCVVMLCKIKKRG